MRSVEVGDRRTAERGRSVVVGVLTAVCVLAFASLAVPRLTGVTLTAVRQATTLSSAGPPAVPTGVGLFAYLNTQRWQPDRPVAFDPCRPIHVHLDEGLAPAGGHQLVWQAIRRAGAATGLRFVLDDRPGGESALPTEQSLLVRWSTPAAQEGLRGRVVGLGGSTVVTDAVTRWEYYRHGTISLDARTLTRLLHDPDGPGLVRAVVMHELGHVVGLSHVADVGELMAASNNRLTAYGPGDREGLANLGRGRCA